MKLNRVIIENFRGIERVEFDAGEYLTGIVGPNAVGKSSILEAIRLNSKRLTNYAFS